MFGWRTTCLWKRSRVVANVQIKKRKAITALTGIREREGGSRVGCLSNVGTCLHVFRDRERVSGMQDHARVTKIRGENRKGAVDQADRTEARNCLSVPGEPV